MLGSFSSFFGGSTTDEEEDERRRDLEDSSAEGSRDGDGGESYEDIWLSGSGGNPTHSPYSSPSPALRASLLADDADRDPYYRRSQPGTPVRRSHELSDSGGDAGASDDEFELLVQVRGVGCLALRSGSGSGCGGWSPTFNPNPNPNQVAGARILTLARNITPTFTPSTPLPQGLHA